MSDTAPRVFTLTWAGAWVARAYNDPELEPGQLRCVELTPAVEALLSPLSATESKGAVATDDLISVCCGADVHLACDHCGNLGCETVPVSPAEKALRDLADAVSRRRTMEQTPSGARNMERLMALEGTIRDIRAIASRPDTTASENLELVNDALKALDRSDA